MDEQQAEDGKDGKFDYLVIGTGLIESMVAHHLASSDSSTAVLQVDPNSFYGQSWAAVELDALQSGSYACTSSSSFTSAPGSTGPSSTSPVRQNKSSAYSLSLQPTLVPARGTFVDALVASNVAPYLSFQLLHAFILAQPDLSLLPLPGSKHDLFRMSQLSLLDKRLLMRFFQAILEPDRLLLREHNVVSLPFLSSLPNNPCFFLLSVACFVYAFTPRWKILDVSG
ncbi:Rab proteins geranylgeranyltransferase component A [Puccinia graminis f. sp. tritici]|uniref:Rab proteins geranylgeranyltransferase component A n=1 Tax=Puccinia graminis f. sp. tritici TaxID=56615 RepID=A0A5B0NDW0_PUCGR|nr:Rab proteins geranylgeranyltransferase component A [Puccinia graminis f. sp. tritici]